MESLHSVVILSTSSLPRLNHPKTLKPISIYPSIPPQNHLPLPKISPFFKTLIQTNLAFTITHYSIPLPIFAAEPILSSNVPKASNKIDVEAIVNSIDDFLSKNPFFIFGCLFIWLIVVPIAREYLSKCKYVSAIDAFRKLRDDPNAELLDIRELKSLKVMASPNLKIYDKSAVLVDFSDENVDGFVKRVLENFKNPENTVVCILDNFDGNSLKVAELLFKNGFKEAYAIKGGIRGENGWLAIQETFLPPSVHIYRRKKKKKKIKISEQLGTNGAIDQQTENNNVGSSSASDVEESQRLDETRVDKLSSPYPNYLDLKPPSSPTPSKP